MQRDLRESASYREAEAIYQMLRRPGSGQICDAADVHASPDGRHAVFAGTLVERLEGALPTRICRVDRTTGECRVMTFGPNVDRLPRYSPDGRYVAFLSDRHRAGDFQLYLLDSDSGAVRATPFVDGWVEYLHWSPDGRRVLLGVAGHGADIAGGQGAVASQQAQQETPAWAPEIETGEEAYRWRRAWLYEVESHEVRQVSNTDTNVWEAAWCGNDALVAVTSPGPSEGLWYTAHLHRIELATGSRELLYVPESQLGWPASSPSGRHVAVVEAVSSDRWFVAGDLLVIDTRSREVRRVETAGIDITYAEWRTERQLLVAGHRGFETVVALYDAHTGSFSELWRSDEITAGYFYACVSGLNDTGDCLLIGESFERAPEIAAIRGGEYRAIKSFDLADAGQTKAVARVERLTWRAPDGLEIQGWLLIPYGEPPYPLVMHIHGGPVGHWRSRWLVRGNVFAWMLLRRGYAVFFPNPRGSSGRGQDFARRVVGDMGGADTYDYLSGLDHLVARGSADPKRLGVTGGSYGGFMTSWLITQDPSRFAAAVPVAPVTNHVTEHLLSNIPNFVAAYLADTYTNLGGKYYQRSPIMHAHQVRTPALNICGALDRCTRPEEAIQFHRALLENGAKSVLVIYPDEGHGVRKFPAAIDYTARLVDWFEAHLRPQTAQ